MSIAAIAPADTYYHPTVAARPSQPVTAVVCVLGPRSCTFAGFLEAGVMGAFEQYTAPAAAGDWDESFLEHSFSESALLRTAPESRTILCDARQIVVPEGLYAEAHLADWIRTCYFMEPEEDLLVTAVSGAPYRVATVCNAPLKKRVAAGKAGKGVYAMGAALLHGAPCKDGECARLLLSADTTYMALWRGGNLLEAVAFPETDAQSVVYHLHSLLHKNGVDAESVTIYAEALYPASETMRLLGNYWNVAGSTADADAEAATWQAVSQAFSRIRACVS